MLQYLKEYTDYGFFCQRYVGLLIDFPENLSPETFDMALCPADLDVPSAIAALRSGHAFLQKVARNLERVAPTHQKGVFEVFLQIDLLWFLGIYGDVEQDDTGCYFVFDKKKLTGQYKTVKTAPESFLQAFEALPKCGCKVLFYKQGKTVDSYRNCDSGVVRFPHPFIARGIALFVQTLISRPCPDYKFRKTFNPVVQCVGEFYHTDMRLFLREECRPPFDVEEVLVALSPEAKERFYIVWNFMAEHYPQCLPKEYGLFDYIMLGIQFSVDQKHRMLGSVGIGGNAETITFYSAMAPESVAEIIRNQVDFNGLPMSGSCGDHRVILSKEGAVNAAKVMDIQAKHNKNAGICK